ncbi:hypothetical protein [Teichococcus aestuarii]|uniref:hypothetical protein n=1 Tax=Teichococcus aestuarii TaxID=568898 RepID=UPI00360A20CA
MAFGLTLLLNAANQALDQLWLHRISRDVGLLLADYPDPGLDSPLEGPASPEIRQLREHLLRIGAQMRAIGLSGVARAILEAPLPEGRRLVLLALAGSAPWQAVPDGSGENWRPAGDGATYRLACRAGGNAAHAPHAMREREQILWLLPTAGTVVQPEPLCRRQGGTGCLSLDVALWEVLMALEAEGEAALVSAIHALQPGGALAAPAALARPARKQASAAA